MSLEVLPVMALDFGFTIKLQPEAHFSIKNLDQHYLPTMVLKDVAFSSCCFFLLPQVEMLRLL